MDRKQRMLGFVCVMMSAGIYGISPLLVSSITNHGAHYSNVMFFKASIAALVFFLISRFGKIDLRISKADQIGSITLGGLRFFTSLFLYCSYTWISTGLATTLHFTFPLFVMLISLLVFHENPHFWGVLCIAISLIGMWLISGNSANHSDMTGVLCALISAVLYALYLITLNRGTITRLNPLVYSMYELLYAAVFSLIYSTVTGHMRFNLTSTGWLIALASAAMMGVCVILMKIGIVRIGSLKASLMCILEPIVSIIMGILFLHETMALQTGIGTLCVISAAVISVFSDQKGANAPAES